MKITEIRVTLGYTYQIEQYHPIRGEFSVLASVDAKDDLESVKADLQEFATVGLLNNLDELAGIHKGISVSGELEPGSLSADFVVMKEKQAEEAEDDEDWMS